MKAERFAQVDQIFQAALERAPAERAAFLDQACGDNTELRSKVEALISSDEEAGSFIERPAFEVAAKMMADEDSKDVTGQAIGPYQILSRLGSGGMGDVYLAHDSRLDRNVALKLLPKYFPSDEQRLRRFEQEARAASALNHPNIITIFEVGTADSIHYIATEYISGHTLRERMLEGRMTLGQALEIAIQVASALTTAHQARIVHRDIKPENIMVRDDGYVKVLDFGLAKLTQQQSAAIEPEARMKPLFQTDAGMVMGTASYMSPEQARGLDVDARSDLWSLAVVLFEMVTGRLPFEGPTMNDVIGTILYREPPSLLLYQSDLPAELERIVGKALTKKREQRYQTAKDMVIDLRNLKRKLEVDAEIDRTGPPEFSISATTGPATATASDKAQHSVFTTNFLFGRIEKHKFATAAAVFVFVISGVALGLYLHGRNTGGAIESIAVLPFENQNRDPNTEYLSDGVTESIINSLTHLPKLRVIARSSVFRYKGKQTDPLEAGKELGVRTVLTGRIVQHGDDLTISVELLDVRDKKQLWGERYSTKLSELLSVQRQIASQITSNLRYKLSGAEDSVTRNYTENSEAYRLYLKGHYFWNKFTPPDHQRAIKYFNDAIGEDPTYALAYAGLCETYGASATNSWLDPREGYSKAMAAANRALQLQDSLAEAHACLGAVTMFYKLDWPAAEHAYRRSLELNPNYALTYEVYSYLLSATGRFDEAIEMAKHGLDADPLSVSISGDIALESYLARRYEDSIEQYRKSAQLDPNHVLLHLGLGLVYTKKAMYPEAIAAYESAIKASERTSNILSVLGYTYAVSGKRNEARGILDELNATRNARYLSPYDLAIVYMGLGERDHALAELNKAYEERAGWIIFLKVDPLFDSLRDDPRFEALVRKMGL
jgi:serine/threonine protein kinase/Flp pilus assembly protein TadD